MYLTLNVWVIFGILIEEVSYYFRSVHFINLHVGNIIFLGETLQNFW